MSIKINNREFTESQLRGVFRVLDTGGTRQAVRSAVRGLQGRGVSNETIKDLRELHRQLRRSQGYNVKVGGTRNLRDDRGQLKRLNRLPARQRIAPSRRPRPPKALPTKTTAVFNKLDDKGRPTVSVIKTFSSEDGPLGDQIAAARREDVYGTPPDSAIDIDPDSLAVEIIQVRADL